MTENQTPPTDPQDPRRNIPPAQLSDDEVDVDLGDEDDQLRHPTIPEGVEYLGSYPTLEDYMRDMLSPEISRECEWLLDYVDWPSVVARFEGKGRLMVECGQVFRIAPATPRPPKGEDPPGPWMPTRGA